MGSRLESISDEDVVKYANIAFPYLLRVVFPLLTQDTTSGRYFLSSAQVFTVAGRYFVLTSAHTLLPVNQTKVGLCRGGKVSPGDARWIATQGHAVGGAKEDVVDIAFMEISEGDVAWLGVECIDVEIMQTRDLVVGEVVFFAGFPVASVTSLSEALASVEPLQYLSVGRAVSGERYTPELHHLLEYPQQRQVWRATSDAQFTSATLPDPVGVSGAGVWVMPVDPDKLISYRNLRLVGVEYAIAATGDVLVCNKIALVVALLGQAFPELAEQLSRMGFVIPNE